MGMAHMAPLCDPLLPGRTHSVKVSRWPGANHIFFPFLYLSVSFPPSLCSGCVAAYLLTIPPYLFYRIGHSCHSEPKAEVERRQGSKSESTGSGRSSHWRRTG